MNALLKKCSQLNKIKKVAIIGALSLTIALSMGSCADSNQITPEKAIDIYMANKDTDYEDDGSGMSVISTLTEDFVYASGASAWGTVVSINSDGSFTVDYHDSELSLADESYPKGTIFKANATGKFHDITRINDYTYSMEISGLEYKNPPDTEEIIDDINYVYSTAYGLDKAKRVYLFTPDTPLTQLPQAFLNGVHLQNEQSDNATLGFYALYNVDQQTVFTSNNK